MNKNFKIVNHPLILRDISLLRAKETEPETFRVVLNRLSILLAVEISKSFKVDEVKIETPLEKTTGFKLSYDVILIPVLRAGLGMVNGFLEIIPSAKVGHIGLQRNEETLEPMEYYFKVPKAIKDAQIILLDPMLATGGSASGAINYLKNQGAENIEFACLVASPEGVERLNKDHSDIMIYTAALDRELNNKGYILPGLGDAGDRTFGTL